MPKSRSLRVPSGVTRMLPGLMSRWTTRRWCAYWTARADRRNSRAGPRAEFVRIAYSWIWSPSTYSMTKYGSPSSVCRRPAGGRCSDARVPARICRSLWNWRSTSSVSIPRFRILTATNRSKPWSRRYRPVHHSHPAVADFLDELVGTGAAAGSAKIAGHRPLEKKTRPPPGRREANAPRPSDGCRHDTPLRGTPRGSRKAAPARRRKAASRRPRFAGSCDRELAVEPRLRHPERPPDRRDGGAEDVGRLLERGARRSNAARRPSPAWRRAPRASRAPGREPEGRPPWPASRHRPPRGARASSRCRVCPRPAGERGPRGAAASSGRPRRRSARGSSR